MWDRWRVRPGSPRCLVVLGVAGLVGVVGSVAFLAGLLRLRYTRADIVGGLVTRLQSTGSSIHEAIAGALGDPTLELFYWRGWRWQTTASAAPIRPAARGCVGWSISLSALDGELEVESPSGGGTRIQARIPCA